MAELPVIRNRKAAKAHDPHKPALVEVPGARVAAVISLLEKLKDPGHDRVGERILALRALHKNNLIGVIVTNVGPGTQAARAGIARGDLLLRYDGKKLDKGETLKSLSESTPPSKSVVIDGGRGTQQLHLQVNGGPLGITVNDVANFIPKGH